MTQLLYSAALLILFSSCNIEHKKDTYAAYVTTISDADSVTSEMMKSNDFTNSIFINEISLKDGQSSRAGLSFIMEFDGAKYLVSAKQLCKSSNLR